MRKGRDKVQSFNNAVAGKWKKYLCITSEINDIVCFKCFHLVSCSKWHKEPRLTAYAFSARELNCCIMTSTAAIITPCYCLYTGDLCFWSKFHICKIQPVQTRFFVFLMLLFFSGDNRQAAAQMTQHIRQDGTGVRAGRHHGDGCLTLGPPSLPSAWKLSWTNWRRWLGKCQRQPVPVRSPAKEGASPGRGGGASQASLAPHRIMIRGSCTHLHGAARKKKKSLLHIKHCGQPRTGLFHSRYCWNPNHSARLGHSSAVLHARHSGDSSTSMSTAAVPQGRRRARGPVSLVRMKNEPSEKGVSEWVRWSWGLKDRWLNSGG